MSATTIELSAALGQEFAGHLSGIVSSAAGEAGAEGARDPSDMPSMPADPMGARIALPQFSLPTRKRVAGSGGYVLRR